MLKLCIASVLFIWTIASASFLKPPDASDGLMHFESYVKKFNRMYKHGTQEYNERRILFNKRLADIEKVNLIPNQLWAAGVNRLTDRTDLELASLKGYRRNPGGARHGGAASGVAQLRTAIPSETKPLPDSFSWVPHLHAASDILDQANCGSCWAHGAMTSLRAHSELFQKFRPFSIQQVVSCAPNTKNCGGTGGCEGSTAELAMDYAWKMGLVSENEFKYNALTGSCPQHMMLSQENSIELNKTRMSLLSGRGLSSDGTARAHGEKLGLMGWRTLPSNKYEPLVRALVEEGPIAVTISTWTPWHHYSHGILESCGSGNMEYTVNHVVALVGYGESTSSKYWNLQNSWGNDWGENGYIRIKRLSAKDEAEHCGWDYSPKEGVGCDGDPAVSWVCGSCGILHDTVMPIFKLGPDGWWSKQGRVAT